MSEGVTITNNSELDDLLNYQSETNSSDYKGTKIGEISELEQSFFESENKNDDKSSPASSAQTNVTNTQENKEEIKETLPEETKENITPQNPEPATTAVQPEKEISSASEDHQIVTDESTSTKETETVDPGTTDTNLSQSLFHAEMNKLNLDYQEGDIIKGTIRTIEKSGLIVDINYKSDGFVANAEYSNDPAITPTSDNLKPGDEISVYIEKLESKEGYTILSKKHADYELAWNTIGRCLKNKETLEVNITSTVQGGLVACYEGIKGFIPASQVIRDQDTPLSDFLEAHIPVVVLQVDRKRRKVIFSHKSAKVHPKKDNLAKIIETIEVGEVRPGKVSSIKDFGVFVDIGGIEGLVHISELSWARVNHPSELLKIGQAVNVFVLGLDKENYKVSLGMKQLVADPWVNIAERYQIGQVVSGTISRIVPFGAFIKIEDNLEGLIHISELRYGHVDNVGDVVSIGLKVQARIIKLNPDEQRIGLSLKGLNKNDDKNPSTDTEEIQTPATDQNSLDAKEEISEIEEIPEIENSSEIENISEDTENTTINTAENTDQTSSSTDQETPVDQETNLEQETVTKNA
jgi:ribosomal protein S1